jgi:solute carrier family 26 (sodium-independent sulfate anion transporter), member 11
MDEEETLTINDNVIHKSNATSVLNIYPTATSKKSSKLRKAFERRFFIITWLRCYDRSAAVADLIAGITLGLTMIPQSIAYASLAGLPSQYGLYAAFMGL